MKWQPVHRLAIYVRNVDWFDFWLKGVEDPAPAKAGQYERWLLLRAPCFHGTRVPGRRYNDQLCFAPGSCFPRLRVDASVDAIQVRRNRMNDKTRPTAVTRRDVLTGAGVAGIAGIAGMGTLAAPSVSLAQSASGAGAISVMKNGQYAKVPLKQEAINVSAIQSRLMPVDVKNRNATLKRSLDHVVKLIDYAQGSGAEWLYGDRKSVV